MWGPYKLLSMILSWILIDVAICVMKNLNLSGIQFAGLPQIKHTQLDHLNY